MCNIPVRVTVGTLFSRGVLLIKYRYWILGKEEDESRDCKNHSEEETIASIIKTLY